MKTYVTGWGLVRQARQSCPSLPRTQNPLRIAHSVHWLQYTTNLRRASGSSSGSLHCQAVQQELGRLKLAHFKQDMQFRDHAFWTAIPLQKIPNGFGYVVDVYSSQWNGDGSSSDQKRA